MIVVDVNVIAYLLIEGEYTESATRLWRQQQDWGLPSLWRHEFLNVLATYVRHGGASIGDAESIWWQAIELFSGCEQEVDMIRALRVAAERNISAYDAQYIALAQELATVCISEDRRLVSKYPEVATTMESYFGNRP